MTDSVTVPLLSVEPHVNHERQVVLTTAAGEKIRLTTHEAAALAVDILNVKSGPPRQALLDPSPERVISLQVHQDNAEGHQHRLPTIDYSGTRDPWGQQHVVVMINRSYYMHGYRDAQRAFRNSIGL